MKKLRIIAPWVLMVAYLPLLLSLSFHKHEAHEGQFDKCPECAHHLAHRSHMAEAGLSPHDCIYCQLTASEYLCCAFNSLDYDIPLTGFLSSINICETTQQRCGVVGTRAPPTL